MPKSKRVSPSDLFVKDKYVSEELRNYAVDKHCLLATASQLNRASVEETEFDHSHIAGGLSKVQTADNVIGIQTSRAMRERGRYQIQFMKTRSSSDKVALPFPLTLALGQDGPRRAPQAARCSEHGLHQAATAVTARPGRRTGQLAFDPPWSQSPGDCGRHMIPYICHLSCQRRHCGG